MEMIWETAHIEIRDGHESAFEAAVQQAVPLFNGFPGCLGMQLHRCIEHPNRYRLIVQWQTLEDHTLHFRNSENFQRWRGLVGEHFASLPMVEHTSCVVRGFGK